MTEAEWLGCTEPRKMLEALEAIQGRIGVRKVWLLGCAWWRCSFAESASEAAERLVGIAEQVADRQVSPKRLRKALANRDACGPEHSGLSEARWVAGTGTEKGPWASRLWWGHMVLDERSRASLLRDVFGNPFRPAVLAPAWRTATVEALAQAGYEERLPPAGRLDPLRLAVLADALEDAGCDERALLEHLRGGGLHVRGCWAVDLILGEH